MPLSRQDLDDLAFAKTLLESPGVTIRALNAFGGSIEKGFQALPGPLEKQLRRITEKALFRALDLAIRSLGEERRPKKIASDRLHLWAAAAAGGAGGLFGLPALVLELPASTAIMLRSIADIALQEGEDIDALETRLSCLSVFALGGRTPADDGVNTGYYAVRAALSKSVADAVRHLAQSGTARTGAPVVVRLVTQIAARFGMVVSEKILAATVPVIGAAGGAAVNAAFMNHFQAMARGHFIIRRLERGYGEKSIRDAYRHLEIGRPAARFFTAKR